MIKKVSELSGKYPDNLKSVRIIWKMCPDDIESVRMIKTCLNDLPGKFPDDLKSAQEL